MKHLPLRTAYYLVAFLVLLLASTTLLSEQATAGSQVCSK